MNEFSAKIGVVNGNPYVFVPTKILNKIFISANKNKGPIPIKGNINGKPYIQTLVKYQGDWRLYVNLIMLKAAGIPFKMRHMTDLIGIKVHLTIEHDKQSRKFSMPIELKKALSKDKKAEAAFKKLSPSHQNEINRYLHWIKTPETKELNIQRIIKHLKGEPTDKLHALMRTKK